MKRILVGITIGLLAGLAWEDVLAIPVHNPDCEVRGSGAFASGDIVRCRGVAHP